MAKQAEKEHGLYKYGPTQIKRNLINGNPKAYEPHTISLGPLYFKNSQDSPLRDYETKKNQLLGDRFPYRFRRFEELVTGMMARLDRNGQWSESLPQPMALDGIFLLQLLREISRSDSERPIKLLSESRPIIQQWRDPEDIPNLENNLTHKFREQRHALTNQEVQEDILKLQNQIPLFALTTIIQWEENTYQDVTTMLYKAKNCDEKKNCDELIEMVQDIVLQDMVLDAKPGEKQDLKIILKRAWRSLSPFNVGEDPDIWPGDDAHLLGYVYENILGKSTGLTKYNREGNQKKMLPATAAALRKKGVNFAVCNGPLNNIRFNRNTWTFHLPEIEIAQRTDAVMRNLMAFELHCRYDGTKPIKCYVELMDQLINTAEDVEVLKDRGIIHHHLGTDQEVANIWNKMRQGYDEEGTYGPIDTAINEVINFYGSYRIWLSEGVEIFFSKPWLIVSFIAGCIIVITAIVQTILSGLQLHHH